jgi:hypothetical protein
MQISCQHLEQGGRLRFFPISGYLISSIKER